MRRSRLILPGIVVSEGDPRSKNPAQLTNRDLVQDSSRTSDSVDRPSPELWLRIGSAVVGIPAIVAILSFGYWGVSIAALAMSAVVGYEIKGLITNETRSRRSDWLPVVASIAIVGTGVTIAGFDRIDYVADQSLTASSVVLATSIALITGMYLCGRFANATARPSGILYGLLVVLALAVLPLMAVTGTSIEWLAFVLVVVFAADTGAYFVGRSLGRHKMAPKISPGKTWEGFAGGVAAGVVGALLFDLLFHVHPDLVTVVGISAAVSTIGVAGDLTESWVKRRCGVKDSGRIIPGHGGLLDRLDALVPNFIFIYFAAAWLA